MGLLTGKVQSSQAHSSKYFGSSRLKGNYLGVPYISAKSVGNSAQSARRALALFLYCAALVECIPGSGALAASAYQRREPEAGQTPAPSSVRLNKDDSLQLALNRANGEPQVVIGVAAESGQGRRLARVIRDLGGRIDHELTAIDYIAAVLPIDMVGQLMLHPSLAAIAVDSSSYTQSMQTRWLSSLSGDGNLLPSSPSGGRPEEADVSAVRDAGVGPPARPLENYYPIMRDMDGVAFQRENPDADGRGIVIAHIESFPDFLSPELQQALDSQGRPVPKFLDIINIPAVSPSLDRSGPPRGRLWTTRLGPSLVTRNGELVSGDRVFKAPSEGTFRLAQLAASKGWETFVNPGMSRGQTDSNATPAMLDVLWRERDRTLWIDTDNDGDFSDEAGVAEYSRSHQIGVMGADDPATELRESVGYAIQAQGDYLSVNVGLSAGASVHATMVAGAAAASRGLAGKIDGVAPGAQLVAINAHAENSTTAFTSGLITAFTDPRVDVVLVEGNSFLAHQADANDGSSLIAVVLQRLTKRYDKPTLVTAANFPHLASSADYGVPEEVLSIGAADSSASQFAHFGLRLPYELGLHWGGAEGPAGNGALKPDLLSLASPVSVRSRNWDDPIDRLVPGIYELPVGYAVCGGTSCATPVAAGVAAALMSAARQRGIPVTARSMHQALRSSAKFLPHIPAYKQGRGVIQMYEAWRHLSGARGPQYAINVTAPVRTAWSGLLETPHQGRGLLEVEGWKVGDRRTRSIELRRTSGPATPIVLQTSWRGNDGTFSTSPTIALALNETVTLNVGINIGRPGVSSAILVLRVSPDGQEAAEIPLTIVAPHELGPENEFSWTGSTTVPRPGRSSHFLKVPQGAEVLTVTLDSQRSGLHLILVDPQSPQAGSWMRTVAPGATGTEVTVERPSSGVWEVVILDSHDRTNPDWERVDEQLPATQVEITASLHAVEAMVEDDGGLCADNRMAPFTGRLVSGALAAARDQKLTIGGGETKIIDIDVEDGQEMLIAELSALSRSAGVDLHLFDCTTGECRISRRGQRTGSSERIIVRRPRPGHWRAVLVGSGPASQPPTRLRFSDVYSHPQLGALSTSDAERRRDSGRNWNANYALWRADPPRASYRTIALMQVPLRGKAILVHDAGDAPHLFGTPSREPYVGLQRVELDQIFTQGSSLRPTSRQDGKATCQRHVE